MGDSLVEKLETLLRESRGDRRTIQLGTIDDIKVELVLVCENMGRYIWSAFILLHFMSLFPSEPEDFPWNRKQNVLKEHAKTVEYILKGKGLELKIDPDSGYMASDGICDHYNIERRDWYPQPTIIEALAENQFIKYFLDK